LIHFYKRDEAEKGLLLTTRAPDTSIVRSPSKEDREEVFPRRSARR